MPYIDPPDNWGEVDAFIRANKLDQEEYFTFCWPYDYRKRVDADKLPVWGDRTRWIAVYMVEGGSEGWYVHVERVNVPEGAGEIHSAYETESIMLGKFWDHERALEAVAMLTRFVYGIAQLEEVAAA